MAKHLAIFPKDYIERIFSGRKTIESRFSRVKCAPYNKVSHGDIIFLKEKSGPVIGEARVTRVISFSNLTPEKVEEVRREYNDRLIADEDFWQMKQDAKYATLMFLGEVKRLSPKAYAKRDRRGWVVIEEDEVQNELF